MEMEPVRDINLLGKSNEELLPALRRSFPVERVYTDFSRYTRSFVPWHWHAAIEFFHVDAGSIIYETPGKIQLFEEGSCGIVNLSVLHTTRSGGGNPAGRLHLLQVDVALLAGMPGSYIDEMYFRPYLNETAFEMLYFPVGHPTAAAIAQLISEDHEGEWGNELRLRERMSKIWAETVATLPRNNMPTSAKYEILRTMIAYVNAHLSQPIRIKDLAAEAFISERECFRLFKSYLRESPGDFILKRRLRYACELLAGTKLSIADIAGQCGMGYAYFSTKFTAFYNCTPLRWRRDNSINAYDI